MNLKLNKRKFIISGLIIIGLTTIFIFSKYNKNSELEQASETKAKSVSVIKLGDESTSEKSLKAVGSVKADTKVSIVAMQSASVREINFNIGDNVSVGQRLVTLNDNNILTSLINAQTDYANRENNLDIVKSSTEQDIKSAEINLANSAKALELSKIQLKSAQDSYDNGVIQIEKNKVDLKNNSIVTYNNNLSVIFDTLDQIDYIIKADGNEQIAGIENVIAAKNKQTLADAKISYNQANDCYGRLLSVSPTPEKALKSSNDSLLCLQKTKIAIDDLITVLDNTISSADFSETTLNSIISKFNQLRLSILGNEANTKTLVQAIENIEINAKADLDRLENTLATANNQVGMAEIAYENALLGLEKTNSLKDQQILSAQIAKDSTLGQLKLARARAGDLYINSPITGIITKKSVEIGEEVSPGKTVAEISQLNIVKILVNLPSDEAYKVKIGKEVLIEEKYIGFISQINPAADSLSKKVEIEIAFDNKDGNLIAETFVNVRIPIETRVKSVNGFYLIPLKSLAITQNENYVYVIENNIAIKKDVEIGEVQDDLVEIKNGLNDGDLLVSEGNKNLSTGDKVEIN